MLKAGSKATKYSRRGKPHACIFKLSADERVLSWEAGIGRSVLKRAARRSVLMSDVVALEVGMSTDVMRRHADAAGEANAHLALSLVLIYSLPAPPSIAATDGAGKAPPVANDQVRETLDVVCQEEEQFGFWISALRALIAPLPPGDPRRRLVPAHLSAQYPLVAVDAKGDAAALPADVRAGGTATAPEGQPFVWQPHVLQMQLERKQSPVGERKHPPPESDELRAEPATNTTVASSGADENLLIDLS